jgi:hypothetical protein
MPSLDWSRVSTKPQSAPWVALAWAVIGIVQLALWASGGSRWMLYAAGLWLLAAGAFTATAAGLIPTGKRRPGQTRTAARWHGRRDR